MQNQQEHHIDKQLRDYQDWIKKIRFFSNTTIIIFAILGGALYCYGYRTDSWITWIGLFIGIYFLLILSKREGHREGYFDGLAQGAYEFENQGLDDEMRAFKSEIEIDKQLHDVIEKSKK